MTLSRKNTRAFTIIELLIVIVVIGILSAIGIMSYSKVQQTSRDAKRSSSISTIAEALENYYQKNGEYPSCTMMSGDSDYVSKTVLSGNIAKDVLSTPTTTSGTNSIQAACADLNTASSDLFSYIGDSSTSCTTGTSCSNYVLKYKEENTGNIITVKSRYGNEKSFAFTIGGINKDSISSITQTSDGGYVLLGNTASYGEGSNDIFINKFDSSNNLSWSKTWGGIGWDVASDIIQTNDGNLVFVGETDSFGEINGDCLIIKFDLNGNLVWNKTWGENNIDSFEKVIQAESDTYVAVGYSYTRGAIISKFDYNGSLIYSKGWGSGSKDFFNSITLAENGDYIITGHTYTYGTGGDSLIVRVNKEGNTLWSKIYGGASFETFNDITKTSNRDFMLSGHTASYGAGALDAVIANCDQDGNLVWYKAIGRTITETSRSILKNIDNTYSISISASPKLNATLVKFDKDGNLLDTNSWGDNKDIYTGEVSQSIDGGIMISGSTTSYGIGSDDGLVIKYKPNGTIEKCSNPMCQKPTLNVAMPTLNKLTPSVIMTTLPQTIATPLATTSAQNPTITNIPIP